MKLLLDTHIWLWSLLEPVRLTRPIAAAMQDLDNELWLSSISIWETLAHSRRGRLKIPGQAEAWIERALRTSGCQEASVTWEVSRQTSQIKLSRRDPADLLIASTARVFDLTLVTADEVLIHGKGYKVLGNL